MYKWETPNEWLLDKIERERDNLVELFNICLILAGRLTPDEIQDIFQGDMDDDGFFDPLSDGSGDSVSD